MPISKATKEAQYRYSKRAKTYFSLAFHNKNDADIIMRMNEVTNKTDYIRKLIRKDIDSGK